MKGDYFVMLVVGIIIGGSIAGTLMLNHFPCEIAEISPDVPLKLKEWCRKQRTK